MSEPDPADVEHILFISLSCVGDAVMTTPVLQALHQKYPQAKVDIVADRRSDDIFHDCPYRDRIYFKDKKKLLRGAPALVAQLLGKRYDIIVDLRTDGLAYLLRGRKRYTKLRAKSYGSHAIETLMGVIRPVHGDRAIPGTHIWLNDEVTEFARNRVNGIHAKSLLAICPGCGGKKKEKFWPVENYSAMANKLDDVFDGVLLMGGPNDVELAEQVSRGLCLPFIDVCNKTSLLQAAALLQTARFFVGSDSGLGHVAGAVGTPTLTLFSVDNPERCLPWGPSASWLMGKSRDARNITVADAEQEIRKGLAR